MRLEPFAADLPPNPVAGDATLDEILALNAERRPNAIALVSPGPGLPRSWREVDRAASALASAFTAWGLGEDAIVGVQLGSSPQGALTCLALWRAGLIPAMLPLAWRRREIGAALASVGASAVVAMVEGGGARLAEAACEVAAGLESIRYVASFGAGPPDGVTPLDDALAHIVWRFERPDRPDDAPEHVAAVTFDAGGTPVARSHSELVAVGVMPFAAARMSAASTLLSTIDLGGLAGLATGLAPWLMTGCAASFHQAESQKSLSAAADALEASHAVLPGRVAARLFEDGAFAGLSPTVTAVWRAPEGSGSAADIPGAKAIVDAILFGELGLYAAARPARERHASLPLGAAGPDGLSCLADLKVTPDGRLLARGPVCPQAPCPAGPGAPPVAFDQEGYLETGLTGVADRLGRRISLGGRRRGVLQIGGVAVAISDLDAAYFTTDAGEHPGSEPDAVFGTRLVVADRETAAHAAEALEAAGFGPAFAPMERDHETPSIAQEPERRSA